MKENHRSQRFMSSKARIQMNLWSTTHADTFPNNTEFMYFTTILSHELTIQHSFYSSGLNPGFSEFHVTIMLLLIDKIFQDFHSL